MPSRRIATFRRPRLGLAAALMGAAIIPVTAISARIVLGQPVAVNPAIDPQQGVYVRDSANAADQFELGKRMERLREWHKSADVYQEILEKFQDRVVPTKANEKGQAVKYTSVTVAVQERLARWPEEGLTVYRGRYEPQASAMLEGAARDDFATLHAILSRYFVTDAARQAGIRLMDLYAEAGDFAEAARIGERLLEWHPGLAIDRPAVLFRTALAYHLLGRPADAARRLDVLKEAHADAIGVVAGKDVLLVEALAAKLQERAPTASVSTNDSWPTFGGDISGAKLSTASGVPGMPVHSTGVSEPALPAGMIDEVRRQITEQYDRARERGVLVNVMPVVDNGELFFHDGFRMTALHLESGVPLPGWVQTYGQPLGQFVVTSGLPGISPDQHAALVQVPRQHTLTVTDDCILAVMGVADPRTAASGGEGTRLVCLERTSGRKRWTASPGELPDQQTAAKNLSFSGTPLVAGDNVYVIARGASAGVEECHLLCYELSTGKYKWACYIASAQTSGMNPAAMQGIVSSDTLSHLAFASGRIFVLTNLGAIAAVDAYSGATTWLSLYPRDGRNLAIHARFRGGGWQGNPNLGSQSTLKPWQFNPLIVQEGKLFALPTDGRHLLIYDAGTGDEVKRIDCEIERGFGYIRSTTFRLTMLLSVAGEKLFVAGGDQGGGEDKVIAVLDWEQCAPIKPGSKRLSDESVLFFGDYADIIGRPFVTASHIYIPTKSRLSILNLAKAKVMEDYPRNGEPWPNGEGPGNIIVAGDHVVVANAWNVNVYADIEAIRRKYQMAIEADPADVEMRIRFWELLFNLRDYPAAMEALDASIEGLGGMRSMRPGLLRERIFNDAIIFARKLDVEPDTLPLAEELFERAEAAAFTPSQQMSFRLTRARFIESLKESGAAADLPLAVRLYQDILSDQEMRILMLLSDGAAQQAGQIAERAIAELIRRAGAEVYAPIEQEAAGKLAELMQSAQPAELLALAESYPNSSVAPRAMMRAAALFEEADEPRLATQVLRSLYLKHRDVYTGEEQVALVEALARNYLKVGNINAAMGRLDRGTADMPDASLSAPLVLANGNALQTRDGRATRTIREAADALRELAQRKSSSALPDAKLPPMMTPEERLARRQPKPAFKQIPGEVVAENVEAIVEPPSDLGGQARHDRILLWSGGQLACASPAQKDRLWSSNALRQEAAGAAWIDERLVAWGGSELALIDGDSGKTLWRLDVASMPGVELVAAEAPIEPPAVAEADRAPDAVPVNARVVIALQRQQLRGGGIVPVEQPDAPPQPNAAADGAERILHVRPLTDRLVVSTTTGRVFAVDLADGRSVWQTRLAKAGGIRQTLASDDFVVIRIIDAARAQLVVLDAFNGRQIMNRGFAISQNNANNWPQNCALAADGTLVWTTPAAIFAKDLYEPGDSITWSKTERSYAGMLRPDQLLISGQEVLAICDGGSFIDRRDLRTGAASGNMLSTQASDASARMVLVGPRLYAISAKALIAYHLEQNTSTAAHLNTDVDAQVTDVLLTRDFVLVPGVVCQSLPLGERGEPIDPLTYGVQAYSRTLVLSRETQKLAESGLLVHREEFQEPNRITAWKAVEGGVYYLSGDNTLHLLRGAGE